MAEMQRKKPKKEKKTDSVDILEGILEQVAQPEMKSRAIKSPPIPPQVVSVPSPRVAPQTPVSTESESLQLTPGIVDPRIKPILPAWTKKPWRWMVPDDPQLKEQWLLTWGEFMLDFSRILNLHILDLQEISLVYPFHNPLIKKKLSISQLILIGEHLIELEKAKWWDGEQKNRLRVYWKTLTNHAEALWEYAFQNGYEMVNAFDIVKMKQSWSSLPPSDVKELMRILVQTKRASWADSDKKTILLSFD